MAVGEAGTDTKSAQGNSGDIEPLGSPERVEKENAKLPLALSYFSLEQ